MDFNDLNLKLKRLSIALEKRYDEDIKSQTKIARKVVGKEHMVEFTFGSLNEVQMLDVIFNAINNIASLKDKIKNKLKSMDKNPEIVEDIINNSDALKLIIDLWNQDKHEYPLTKTNRSNKNPKIINVNQGLVISKGEKASVSFTITENKASYKSSENAAVAISGEVVDQEGNFIISVENMFRHATTDLESLLKSQGLI